MALQPQSVRSYLFSFHEMIGNETKAGLLDVPRSDRDFKEDSNERHHSEA
jgi:hypothetical protein